MAEKLACEQAPSESEKNSASEVSSPDRSRLIPLALDYTRLTRPKPKREPVRRLPKNQRIYPIVVPYLSSITVYFV